MRYLWIFVMSIGASCGQMVAKSFNIPVVFCIKRPSGSLLKTGSRSISFSPSGLKQDTEKEHFGVPSFVQCPRASLIKFLQGADTTSMARYHHPP